MATQRAIMHILDDGADDPYRQLVEAVIWRAAIDARADDGSDRAKEAAAWLRSDSAAALYDALDLSGAFRARLQALGPPAAVEYHYQFALPLAASA